MAVAPLFIKLISGMNKKDDEILEVNESPAFAETNFFFSFGVSEALVRDGWIILPLEKRKEVFKP